MLSLETLPQRYHLFIESYLVTESLLGIEHLLSGFIGWHRFRYNVDFVESRRGFHSDVYFEH